MSKVNVSRRAFIKGTLVAGGGLLIGYSLYGDDSQPSPLTTSENVYSPNLFLELMPDNSINFYCPRDEMGQGITTGLTTLVAEELDVAPSRFNIKVAGLHDDYANPAFGSQATGGSTSMKVHYMPLRQMAANVRALLVNAASTELGVSVASIRTEDAQIIASGQSYPYSRFLTTAANLELPTEAPLKKQADFRYIGVESHRLDAVEKSTGTAMYGMDVELPGMHYVAVLHSPVADGKLKSCDRVPAKSMPGVTDVIETSFGLAVVAKSYWQARKAVSKLQAHWTKPKLASLSSESIRERYQHAMASESGTSDLDEGDTEAAFANADAIIKSQYWAPYLAHAPMEPMNATARVQDGKLEVWSGSQAPGGFHKQLVRHFGLDDESVAFHNLNSGGAFGRRSYMGHVLEAAEVAMLTKHPVQLIWSREDDIRHGHYRPASLMTIKAGVNVEGKMVGWSAKRVGSNVIAESISSIIGATLSSGTPAFMLDAIGSTAESLTDSFFVDPSSVEGIAGDYDFANKLVKHVTVDDGLPLGFWRSVGHSFTAFAKESAVDELAHAKGIDPVQFRLDNTTNNQRLNKVIRAVDDRLARTNLARGHHIGFAAHGSFDSYVAEAAEVSVAGGKIRVHKVICAVDCGVAVNPNNVRMQMEGGIMFGLTAALYGDINIKDGVVQQSNFHDYQILRINEAPDVEVIVINSSEPPTGVGEPGLPPIAPAVANAVFAATGQRLRELPLRLG